MASPRIFVSYSHADSKQKERLLTHLDVLSASAEFDVSEDSQIKAGERWQPAIEQALDSANVAILLLSADFLSSSFIRQKEVPAILQHREQQDLRLYPVLAKPCAWQAVPWIEERQMRPIGAKPVWRSGGRYAEDELARIALEMDGIIKLQCNVLSARDEAARKKAEEEKRQKEQAIAEVIANSPDVESIYPEEREGQAATTTPTGEDVTSQEKLDRIARDQQEARKIYEQIVADSERFKFERLKIMQDLQSKIFQITQDSIVNRPKGPADAFNNMDKYIRS